MEQKFLIALVGMPGSGKSEAAAHLQEKGIPFVRFGDLTEETAKQMGLPLTPENERLVREKLREEFGMAAFAIKAKPKIEALLKEHKTVALDGLYSWEEYKFLKEQFPELILIHIFAEPNVRYQRLASRKIRPFTVEESRERDTREIEKLNKGGPIAIADYQIENSSDHLTSFASSLDGLLNRLHIH
jgi:dephospho-CoA kinase